MKDAAVLLGLSFVLFAGGSAAAAPDAGFDQQTPDAAAVVKSAREDSARAQTPLAAGPAFMRWTRDCEDLSFEGDRMLSDSVVLKTTTYREECHHIPPAGQICHEVPMSHDSRQVRLKIEGRDPLPAGEKEVFSVCLDGWYLSARARKSTRKYTFEIPDRPEGLDFIITARPKKK